MSTQPQRQFNILLIGDSCLDVYQYGTVDRISPEAPVPVFKPTHEERRPGMAANVNANLKALGLEVSFITGKESVKTRLIDYKSRQQLLRIDEDVKNEPVVFETAIPQVYHAIVISDYNKGLVTYELIKNLREEFPGPIFVDTKKTDLAQLEGCIVKINELEYNARVSDCSNLIVTVGRNGAIYKEHIFPAPEIEVTDVCGAGDTFLSALTYQYLISDGNMERSIQFAVRASAITVQHTGVYAPKLEEIR